MKIEQLINEAPLPPDWEPSVYGANRASFKNMIAYAKERAEQIGQGSSRVAFLVKYEGRDTVLKIAKNRKGLAQNQEEAGLFGDAPVIGAGDIVVPMIDYDEQGPQPTWIHVEYAPKLKNLNVLMRYLAGEDPALVFYHLEVLVNGRRNPPKINENVFETDMYQSLSDLGSTNMSYMDLNQAANWGIYRGKPVIIDLGLNQTTAQLYGMRI